MSCEVVGCPMKRQIGSTKSFGNEKMYSSICGLLVRWSGSMMMKQAVSAAVESVCVGVR